MITFKHPGLKNELEGKELNPKLRAMVFTLAGFAEYFFGKSIVITEILRSQATQDKYYKDNLSYQKHPWKSVHQFGCGVDVRISNFTEAEVEKIKSFLIEAFEYGDDKHSVIVIHDIGLGKHIHLQAKPV